jgi:hypothetical protein
MAFGTPVRLNAETLLDLAERATQLSSGQWSLALLQAAFPRTTRDDLLDLPVGSRDWLIMAVRARLVAAPLRSEPECTDCGAHFELTVMPDDLGFGQDAAQADPDVQAVHIEGQELMLRPVRLSDLLAVETLSDIGQAAQCLAERVSDGELAGLTVETLEGVLETLDPVADIWLNSHCPECGAEHSLAFDPVHYTAQELRQRAQQILRDVTDIARAFHWSEHDILALPGSRRAYYVAEALA